MTAGKKGGKALRNNIVLAKNNVAYHLAHGAEFAAGRFNRRHQINRYGIGCGLAGGKE
jgi:hypothetical protein